jgi:hypothetical protein
MPVETKSSFEQAFLLSADRHWDNPKSLQALQLKHLVEAKKRKAGIIDIGDLFCAMQGKFDRRSDKDSIRPEHMSGDYLDLLVDTATEFFGPYRENFIRLAHGNHEVGVKKNHETDLTNRLVKALNGLGGCDVHFGGISGWVHFRFLNEHRHVQHRKLWYHHGYGGGGPVTRGVIQSNRKAVYTPDADFVVSGHIHEEWDLTIPRVRLSNGSEIYLDEQFHIQVPTYKEEYGDGSEGWHNDGGRPPKPIGAKWLVFTKEANSTEIIFRTERAK